MIFQCETRTDMGRSGEVSMIAVHWTEARRGFELMLHVSGILSLCAGAGSTLIGIGQSADYVILGVLLLALSLFAFWQSIVLAGRSRIMQLHRDGTIVTPLGMADWPKHTNWGWKHGQFMRVEKEQLEQPTPQSSANDRGSYLFGVRVYMRGGAIFCIARYLDPDEAHMVAVRLNEALEQLRSGGGGSSLQWSADGRNVYID